MEQVLERVLPGAHDVEVMHDFVSGRAFSAAIYVAAKLGIADHLLDGPKDCMELANILGADESSLYRLMRALSSINVFTELDNNKFSITPMAATMRSDIPNSLRHLIIMCGEDWHWTTWGGLLHTVKTGEPYFTEHFKMNFFEYARKNPEISSQFNAAMKSLSSLSDVAISNKYNFSGFNRVIDIGGGEGGLLAAVLKAHTHLTGVLYDLEEAINNAKVSFGHQNLLGRCELISGNFFEAIPSDGDLYVIKHVLHGLDQEQSTELLRKVANKIKSKGKVIVIEMLIPERNIPSFSKFNDLGMMLLSSTGRERTQAEFQQIFLDAGLTITKILPIQMGLCVIEAE